ncbi:unnamed protein product [Amoebophrya sp. A25]|nr:unnamed protein product [Amoebophrya sp. A25]|eukprot:GSA25T00002620001.1
MQSSSASSRPSSSRPASSRSATSTGTSNTGSKSGSQNVILKGKDLEAFKYGHWQSNDVLRALFDRIPDKEMALLLNDNVYGPYVARDSGDPALTTLNIPFAVPAAEDPVILGQLITGLTAKELILLSATMDDEFVVKSVEVERIYDGEILTTICYIYREEFAPFMLTPVKWNYELHFAALEPVVERVCLYSREVRRENELTYTTSHEFEEEDVRAAVRLIQYKKETNKNYMGQAFVDRTPTLIRYDDF